MNDSNYYSTYNNWANFRNPEASTNQLGFIFGNEMEESAWAFPYSNAYDYYVTISVSGVASEEEFTFYPSEFRVTYFNHDYTFESFDITDKKISHYDSIDELGFLVTGKIPDTVAGNRIRSFYVRNANSGTVPADMWCTIYVTQVPKPVEGAGSVDSGAIVSAIQDQTSKLQQSIKGYTNKLYEVTDEQQSEFRGHITEAQDRLDMQVMDNLFVENVVSENLVGQLRGNNTKYQVYFPGVRGPFLPGGGFATIIEPQYVDMSFLDNFSIITDAIGVVMLGLCGWKTLEYLRHTAERILGKVRW